MKLKKHVLAFAIAVAALFTMTATSFAAGHPDGTERTMRGWGATTLTADGYVCTLYNELGIKVGTLSFNMSTNTVTVNVAGGTLAATDSRSGGVEDVTAEAPLNLNSFPNIPARFQNGDYELQIHSVRAEDGANVDVTSATGVFSNSGVIDARCVYIVPIHATPDNPNRLPVFCLNCIFVIS